MKKISLRGLLVKILTVLTDPIIFKEYDSGLVTLAASTATTVTASYTSPGDYVGYPIRCRISNGTGGSGESGCNPYNYFFGSGNLSASVRNNFTSQAKVHVLFTVIWVKRDIVGSI